MKQRFSIRHHNRNPNITSLLILFLFGFGCYTESKLPSTENPSNTVLDEDGDGYSETEDCNDGDPYTHNGATELCDGIDNDCDGTIDEGVLQKFYTDADDDGFGDPDTETKACEATEGFVSNGNDCDDNTQETYPGATEICDGIDNDCDGTIDEEVGETYHQDLDGDGFGTGNAQFLCEETEGWVQQTGDCDDNNEATHPDATEICDGVDNDCDENIDEEVSLTQYPDNDSDGFGNNNNSIEACTLQEGYSESNTDCDDYDSDISPAAEEICDYIDNDCDETIDEGTSIVSYLDSDEDGFGDSTQTQESCIQPTGYILSDGDCDDGNENINPDAEEICDSIDNNCNEIVDENTAIDVDIWYLDSDEDGFGDSTQTQESCTQPTGYILNDGDCDDGNENINPDADEICDSIDNDCDGTSDGGAIGSDPTCSALSCLDVLNENSSSTDGVYWIDPQGSGAYEAFCDMSQNGGGWTLLLKTDGLTNTHFYYSDPKWSNSTLYNETSIDISNTTAKLEPFVSLDVEEFYGCFPTQNSHCIYANTSTSQTAQQLFSGGVTQIGNGFNNQMYSGWSYQYNCNFFGFNSTYGGLRVRFGFSANQENNCNSNDTAIGFGLGYPNTPNNITNYNSGEICAWEQCSLSDYTYEGFPGFLWGR